MAHIRASRSWLFVPGDSERKLAKVAGVPADVVIVDLEDAVMPEAKPAARMLAHDLDGSGQRFDRGDAKIVGGFEHGGLLGTCSRGATKKPPRRGGGGFGLVVSC